MYVYFLKYFIYLFLEREEGREKERERNVNQLPFICTLDHRGLNRQPRLVPGPESNQRPFTLQDDAQPTEPHQSGPEMYISN